MITNDERNTIARQVGRGNILCISGGRVRPIEDGIELPVSNGYMVRIELTAGDDYTVSRVFRRSGREWIKGQRTRVYCDEVGEAAYRAGMFRSWDETQWPMA